MPRAIPLALLCVGLALGGALTPAPAAAHTERALERTGAHAEAALDAPLPLCLRAQAELDMVARIQARAGCGERDGTPSNDGGGDEEGEGTDDPSAPPSRRSGGLGGSSRAPLDDAPEARPTPTPAREGPPGEPEEGALPPPEERRCTACDPAAGGSDARAAGAVPVAQGHARGLLGRLVDAVATYLALA